jgi:hypothetical protein
VAKAQVSAHNQPTNHPIPQKGKEGAEGEMQAEVGNGAGNRNSSSSSPVPEEAVGENKPKAKDDDASDASRSILSKVCTVEFISKWPLARPILPRTPCPIHPGPGPLFTQDYTTSPLHRFRVTGSRNYANIAPPSATLHVSNVPVESTEDDIKALFAQHGAVSTIKIIPYVDSWAPRELDYMLLTLRKTKCVLIWFVNCP